MHFDLNDEQRAIKDTARELLGARCKPAKVRQLAESRSYDDAIWSEICALGWPGIAISEDNGGQGLGMVELAVLCEEIGYACAPMPFLSNALAGLLIEHGGDDEQRSRWLPGIASGEQRGAAALATDETALIADADGAAVLALLGDGERGRLVEPGAAALEPLELIDATRSFAHVSASGGGELDVRAGLQRGYVALAAELTGIAQKAMEMAVDYARDREQFGRPIGAYQAVSHSCAAMLLAVEESRSLTYFAAWAADAEPDSLPLASHMAKARASDAAWEVAASALQVFGGIGFTWEHDLHFWLKRARVAGRLLGSPREHRDRVAELTLERAGAPQPA